MDDHIQVHMMSLLDGDTLTHAVWLTVVAIIWGATNPLIKRGSAGIENIKCSNRVLQFLAELKFLACKWQHIVPFLLNQSGSVLYYYTIGQADISLAVPITNSLTLVVTMATGRLLGERVKSQWTYIGVAMVTSGVALCVFSKV